MPRPRTILWVDDEIESLTSQILFLEGEGFAVERATNGDDALALLQRQPYGVVLLDDAARLGERMVARQWKKLHPELDFELWKGGAKGTLIGRRRS